MPNAIQAKQRIYLEVAKAKKEDLNKWKRGVSIELRAGETIGSLAKKAYEFRVRLAASFLKDARREASRAKPCYRIVIGRGYYAMYHAVRALVYLRHGGDDHESHSTVARNLPDDFPDRADWINRFGNARLDRNRADYDPFPLRDASYKAAALRVLSDASELSDVIMAYLQSKGVTI
ncbi:HEPN domain-containing protein [Marilutibacter aestuarii]|uniref:HEPN domain-containing protein n=1 Tax=Marilutibacter aestuarii TaxID=1706195 RepID=A0A508A9P6_9GAMM|nr:HEPN domain-containing protein [Lysobacter aestuarii]TQD46620.1 HEPN domain-containing protein [Lysobacter aestuarii]